MFSLITAGRGWGLIFFKELFLYVILKLCAKFQCPTMPATGQKVCGVVGVVVVWCGGVGCKSNLAFPKPQLVFNLFVV